MSDLREKLRKILELARTGSDGERDNAQERLEYLLTANGLTLDDIDDETRQLEWFKYKRGIFSRRLLCQTIYAVTGSSDIWRKTKKTCARGAKVTKSEKLEIELRFEAYTRALDKEFNTVFDAFINVNRIYPAKTDEKVKARELSDEQMDDLIEAMRRMRPVEIRRALS